MGKGRIDFCLPNSTTKDLWTPMNRYRTQTGDKAGIFYVIVKASLKKCKLGAQI